MVEAKLQHEAVVTLAFLRLHARKCADQAFKACGVARCDEKLEAIVVLRVRAHYDAVVAVERVDELQQMGTEPLGT